MNRVDAGDSSKPATGAGVNRVDAGDSSKPASSTVVVAVSGADLPAERLCGFLAEFGVAGRPTKPPESGSPESGHSATVSVEIDSAGGDSPPMTLDLAEVLDRPDLLAEMLGALGVATRSAAVVRVATARHLSLGQPLPEDPRRTREATRELSELLPEVDPDAGVAIVIPCWDVGELLLDALASIRLCAPEHFDLVVVDDGSTDAATLDILEAVERSGIVVAHQEHSGPAAARNLGLELTTAPFVIHLDADNLLRPGFATRAAELLEAEDDVAVVSADAEQFGATFGLRRIPVHDETSLLTGNYLDTFSMARRVALAQVGNWDESFKVGEDWEIHVALTAAGWRVAELPIVGVDYRVRSGQLSSLLEDPAVRIDMAVAVAEKHHMFYEGHIGGVVRNYLTALLRAESSLHVGPDPEAQRKVRELTDDLAVSRSEQDHQAQAARAAREVVAAAEARSLAAEDEATAAEARAAVTAALAAEAEARAAAAEARAAAAAAEAASLAGRAAAAEAELAAVLATRTFRWSSGLRTTYGRFRGGNP